MTHTRSSRAWQGRARADDTISCSTTPSSAAAGSAAADAAAGGVQAAVAAAAVLADELTERAALMFKLDATGPAASGLPAAAPTVTKELVHAAWLAANELCDEHGPALSQAYGNFERVVALGWLLGDVAQGRLIELEDAFKVGRKAGKLGPGLKAEFDAPGRKVGKRKHASEEDWAEAAITEKNVRAEAVKFDFGDATATATATATETPPAPEPATETPKGKTRMSRIIADPSDAPEEAAERALTEVLRRTRHEVLTVLRAAEGRVLQAQAAVDGAKHEYERAVPVYNDSREWLRNPRRGAATRVAVISGELGDRQRGYESMRG